jgi:hypothetical protein
MLLIVLSSNEVSIEIKYPLVNIRNIPKINIFLGVRKFLLNNSGNIVIAPPKIGVLEPERTTPRKRVPMIIKNFHDEKK